MPFTEALNNWFEYNQRHTPRTQQLYKMVVVKFCEEIPITTIKELAPIHVNLYISRLLSRGLTNRTCNGYLAAIKSWAKYLAQNYQIDNFAAPIKMLKTASPRQRFFTPEEYDSILAVCKKRKVKDLIITLGNTGLRATEMAELGWDNINEDMTLITIIGKGRKRRVIPINSAVRKCLLRYPRKPETPIQFSKSRRAQYKLMCRLCQKVSIERAGPHALRHYFATQLLSAGVSLTKVSRILGHHSTDFTERLYIHLHLPTYLLGSTECLCK